MYKRANNFYPWYYYIKTKIKKQLLFADFKRISEDRQNENEHISEKQQIFDE